MGVVLSGWLGLSEMLKLVLSDHEKAKEQIFLDGELKVLSRSGLNVTEVLLLEHFRDWRPGEKVLVIENRSTVLPLALQYLYPDANVEIQAFDHFYAQQIQKRLKCFDQNQKIQCHLAPDLPNDQDYSEIYLQVTQSISAEFVAELLQTAYGLLQKQGRLLVSSEGQHRHTETQIMKKFGSVTRHSGKQGSFWIIKKNKPLKKLKQFTSEFKFSLPNGLELQMVTRPGVFSHRRVDEGAQALAECMEIRAGERVLELGCGHGGVGLLAKKMAEKVTLYLVDSHARAIQCAQENAQSNHLEPVHTILSSEGLAESLQVDVFLGNPPYFSDHSISKHFIDQAHFHLKKGGRLYLVAKNMDWNLEYAQELFENCEVISRRQYRILKAFRKDG